MNAPWFVRATPRGGWEALTQDGDPAVAAETLDALVPAAPAAAPVVLVPAERVVLLTAAAPTRNRPRLLQALPFMLEERLADDVDDLHFAVGPIRGDGTFTTAVVARADMEGWLADLEAAGLEPRALVSDVLCLPLEPQSWSVLCEPGRCLVREGAHTGWASEPDNLAPLLAAAVAAAEPPPARIVVRVAPGAEAPVLPADYGEGEHRARVEVDTAPAPVLAKLGAGWRPGEGIDLLQGAYRRGEDPTLAWRRWRIAGLLVVGLIGAELGFMAFENHRLQSESEALGQRIEALYRETFPEARRIVDARVQMQQHLERLRTAANGADDGHGLLALLERVAPRLPEEPGVGLSALHYRGRALELDLTAPDFQALDRLRQRLVEDGLAARLGSARRGDDAVSGRLTITAERST